MHRRRSSLVKSPMHHCHHVGASIQFRAQGLHGHWQKGPRKNNYTAHKDICVLWLGRALQGLAKANLQTLEPNLYSIGLPPCFLHCMETWKSDVKVSLWLILWGCPRALYEVSNDIFTVAHFCRCKRYYAHMKHVLQASESDAVHYHPFSNR